jgi:hypothetical protein
MAFSTLSALALAGLVDDKGLGPSVKFANARTKYAESTIQSNIIAIVTANVGDVTDIQFLANVGKNTAPYLTNHVPDEYIVQIKSNLAPVLTAGNVSNVNVYPYSDTLSNVGDIFFKDGLGTFIIAFNSVVAHCYLSLELIGALQKSANTTLGNLGPGFSSLNDIATNGIGTAGTDLENIVNFGKMFDWSKYQYLSNPAYLVFNLISIGLGDSGALSTKAAAAGLTDATLDTINPEVVNGVLKQITGNDLQKIITTTGYKPLSTATIASLYDVMDVKKILPEDPLNKYSIKTMKDLSDVLLKWGGTFKTPLDHITFLKSITNVAPAGNVTSTPAAQSAQPLINSDKINKVLSKIGTGTGPIGNPIIPDYFGSIDGFGHLKNFEDVTRINNQILNQTALGAQIKTAIKNITAGIGTWVPGEPTGLYSTPIATDLTNLETALNNLATNAETKDLHTQAKEFWTSSITHLNNEQNLLSKIGLDFTVPITGTTVQMSFGQQLAGLGLDSGKLGTYQFINDICTEDEDGDAIKAALAERRNATKLTNAPGVTSPTVTSQASQIGLAENIQNTTTPLSATVRG